jgi:drug/metabolite transporter (DMT)-like permease
VEAAQLETQPVKLNTYTPLLAMAGVNVIWGAAFPITKPALESIPPFTFALLRFVVALAVLVPLAGRPALALLRGPDRRRFVVMGLLGFCIAQVAQTAALRLSPASDISLLAPTTPLWIALLAWLWLGERLSRRGMLGFALALGGLLLSVWPQGDAAGKAGARLLGDAIFLLNCLTWAGYNLMGRAMMARHDPLPATTAAGLVGTLGIVPFAAGEWLTGSTLVWTPIGVAAVAYTGLLVPAFGFLVLFWALRRVRAAPVAIMMYLQPVAGVLLAWLWLGERLEGAFFAGAALVLAGVGLVTIASDRVTG